MDFSDPVFEALLLTGWNISVDVGGRIMAQRDDTTVFGAINEGDGSVTWADHMGWAIKEARIQYFKQRIEEHKAAE
jgi:hypothetical protein